MSERADRSAKRGRKLCCWLAVLLGLVHAGSAYALRERFLEPWYVWKIHALDRTYWDTIVPDEERWAARKSLGEYIERLGTVRSTTAARALVRLALRYDQDSTFDSVAIQSCRDALIGIGQAAIGPVAEELNRHGPVRADPPREPCESRVHWDLLRVLWKVGATRTGMPLRDSYVGLRQDEYVGSLEGPAVDALKWHVLDQGMHAEVLHNGNTYSECNWVHFLQAARSPEAALLELLHADPSPILRLNLAIHLILYHAETEESAAALESLARAAPDPRIRDGARSALDKSRACFAAKPR